MKRPSLLLLLACWSACVDLQAPYDPVSPLTDGSAKDAGVPKDLSMSIEAGTGGAGGQVGSGGNGGGGGSVAPGTGGLFDETPVVEPGPSDAAPPPVETAPPIDSGTPPPPNQAPTVPQGAMAAAAPVTGTSTLLSVLGADDQGEAALVYTWATKGAAPGPVGFSTNGVNAAKSVTATFTVVGSYSFEVVVRDAGGLAVTSAVNVQVVQTPNDVSISPITASLTGGGSQQFTAKVFDQFGAPLTTPVNPVWSMMGTCGSVNGTGLFVAAYSASSCSVIAAVGSASDPAEVVVGGAAPVVLAPVADTYVEESNDGKNFGTNVALQSKVQDGAENTRHTYLRFMLPAAASITKATLSLYGRSDSSTTREGVVAVADNSWSETGMTWKNRPDLGATRSIISITTTAKYREWDVTALVQQALSSGQTQVTMALRMEGSTSNSPDSFNSREASSNPPQLVLTP